MKSSLLEVSYGTRKPIKVLALEVTEKLKQLNYAYNTLCGLRASFMRICAFAQDRDELYFSEKFGKEYLKEKYGCTTDYYLESFPVFLSRCNLLKF